MERNLKAEPTLALKGERGRAAKGNSEQECQL